MPVGNAWLVTTQISRVLNVTPSNAGSFPLKLNFYQGCRTRAEHFACSRSSDWSI